MSLNQPRGRLTFHNTSPSISQALLKKPCKELLKYQWFHRKKTKHVRKDPLTSVASSRTSQLLQSSFSLVTSTIKPVRSWSPRSPWSPWSDNPRGIYGHVWNSRLGHFPLWYFNIAIGNGYLYDGFSQRKW